MTKYWLPWLVGMPAETALAICSVIFGGVLERLPQLRIAFAHGGGAFPGHARPHPARLRGPARPVRRRQRGAPARVPGPLLRRLAGARPRHAPLIVRLIGAERIALGSDYPFPLGRGRARARSSNRCRSSTAARASGCSPAPRSSSWLGRAMLTRRGRGERSPRTIDERDALEADPRSVRSLPNAAAAATPARLLHRQLPRAAAADRAGAWSTRSSTTGRGSAVDGTSQGETPWLPYHELPREPAARLVGAQPDEVVVMNTLTVNLHLMMATFYRPHARSGTRS